MFDMQVSLILVVDFTIGAEITEISQKWFFGLLYMVDMFGQHIELSPQLKSIRQQQPSSLVSSGIPFCSQKRHVCGIVTIFRLHFIQCFLNFNCFLIVNFI